MSRVVQDPRQAKRFCFSGSSFDPATGEATLSYAFDDGARLHERIVFPHAPWPQDTTRQSAFFRALDILHLVAGVSYYKAGLPRHIETGEHPMDPLLAGFAQQLYVRGLGEFAHVNSLEIEDWVRFSVNAPPQSVIDDPGLSERALLAMGGGKDSLVSLEMLREAGIEIQPISVGDSDLIRNTAAAAGLPLIQVHRTLAPELVDMNAAGAYNGHVPVTAINSAILLCAALLYDCKWVVFSNERSAEEATLTDARGRPVNHQFSKSLEFEQAFRGVVHSQVSPGIEYFSLLRPLAELAVAKKFSTLAAYHPVFSSCNRNFHRDGPRISGYWCRDCPKCRFTTLALAPFMLPVDLEAILGANLLDQAAQEQGFRALCALGVDKPFECVGSVAESRAALMSLSTHEHWKECALVKRLAPLLDRTDTPGIDEFMAPDGTHFIPSAVLEHVAF